MAFYLIKAKYSAQGFRGLLERPQDIADSTKVVLAACGAGPCEIFYSISAGALFLILELDARQIGALEIVIMCGGDFQEVSSEEMMRTQEFKSSSILARGIIDVLHGEAKPAAE
jgi:hypothetical protein